MKRKILSVLAAVSLLGAALPVAGAAKTSGDKVTLIIEADGGALLESRGAALMGASLYNDTDAAKTRTAGIMSTQRKIQSEIKNKIDKNAETGFTYTNVFNGFSMTCDKSDIEKIKSLENVKNVYIAGSHQYIEPLGNGDIESASYDNCCKMINVPYMHENGYKGQGQAIAVIDSELDVNHEFFASPLENPKYSKSDISDIISSHNLNVNISANRVYRNEKIPFAYSYANDNADVYSLSTIHGSHVCGIAAGKSGTRADGTKFSGVAPEAQIIFMGILKQGTSSLPDEAIIAAIDDASKMGVAAINMSLGADFTLYGGDTGALFEKVINAAVNAGIVVCSASGNAGNSGILGYIPTENVDYSVSGIPARVSASTSVASVSGNTGKISSFSSWGTDTTLELKPEISAPGGSIYSSVPDDKYAVYSGTSMATPHIAGAVALMRQYVEEKYAGKYQNPAPFIENLMMSGANKIWNSETNRLLYSPRQQGAGLIDLKAAAETPVILLGTGEKSKISLGDKLQNTFKISFTAQNLTNSDVTYDALRLSLMTDDYKTDSLHGNVVSGSKNLSFTSDDMPSSVTVPAGGKSEISFNVTLDAAEAAENMNVFTNGFYLEGFVELSACGGAVPTISIPYVGFYGDWTDAETFDKPYYDGGEMGKTFLGSGTDGCVCDNTTNPNSNPRCNILGKNQILEELITKGLVKKSSVTDYGEYESESYAGVSPNGDGDFDFLCAGIVPQRPIEGCEVRVENSQGKVMELTPDSATNDGFDVLSNMGNFDKFLINCTDYNDLSSLPDGDYTLRASGKTCYAGARDEEIAMRFYVDTKPPEIVKKEIRSEGGKTYIDLTVSDNRYVMGAKAVGKDLSGNELTRCAYSKAAKSADMSIDVTDADMSTLTVTALDYAYNKAVINVEAGNISVTDMSAPVYENGVTALSFALLNGGLIDASADIIAAVYDGNGALTAVSVNGNETVPRGESSRTLTFDGEVKGMVKLMIFDSLRTLKPLGFGETFVIE